MMRETTNAAFLSLCSMLKRRSGLRYATVLRFVERDGLVHGRRDFTTVPDAYPAGPLKPLPQDAWLDKVYRRRQRHLADGAEAIRAAYPDHELVFHLGASRLVNVPIVTEAGCIALLNLAQGGEDSWQELERSLDDAASIAACLLEVGGDR